MTSLVEARATVYSTVKAAWLAAGESADTIFYDNIPEDGSEPTKYIIASFQSVSGEIATLGPCEFELVALLIVQVFTPSRKGTLTNDTLCQAIVDRFLAAPPGNVRILNPGIVYAGVDGNYFQQNVNVEIEYRRFVSETTL